MKILLVITTGRDTFKGTADMLAEVIKKHSSLEHHQVDLLINYDTKFKNLPESSFRYESPKSRYFSSVKYYGKSAVSDFKNTLTEIGVDKRAIALLSIASGYGNKKNIVILTALRDEYDYVIFWDDDEYPVYSVRNNEAIEWYSSDLIKEYTSNRGFPIDIACGYWTGFISTIPLQFNTYISRDLAIKFGEALSIGSDVVDRNTFINSSSSFVVLNSDMAVKKIEEINGVKWVGGGNVAYRVDSIRSGRVPPFYTPDGSRGEDTIHSMQLKEVNVYSVPVGVFHDAFSDYKDITKGRFPKNLVLPDKGREYYMKRFSEALFGWLTYAPLYIRLRYGDGYANRIAAMIEQLQSIEHELYTELYELKFLFNGVLLTETIKRYSNNVEQNYAELMLVREEWLKVCKSI